MEYRTWYMMFLTCQLVMWMTGSSYGDSLYGAGNGHTAKKGSDKRYGDHDYYDRSRTSNIRTCSDSFEVKPNFIIRTKESLDNEATFIDSLKVATSRSCTEKCCASYGVVGDDGETRVTCDLAVFVDGDHAFENKDSNCFLFQCRFDEGDRFRCKFSDHDSYTSSMAGGFGTEPYINEENMEEQEEEGDEIPQTKPVPLFTKWKDDKEPIQENSKVEEAEECNANQFQCNSGECIRLTLLCDDYEDCPDRSDESDSCNTISGEVAPTHNGNESQLAHSTNPPKLHITNPKQQWSKPTTTDMPYSDEDDTIFSELAQQLHKEGAKQKMQVDNDFGNLERQRGNQYKQQESDWHDSRHPSKDRTEEIPQNEQDENEHGDDQWQPRQGERQYDRPRHQDSFEVDNSKSSNEMDHNYRDYPKRPLDDSNDDTTENDNREGDSDHDGSRSKEQDRYVDGDSRYSPKQTELESNQYGKKQIDKENDKNIDQVSSNNEDDTKSEHSQGKSQQDYNSKANKDILDSHNSHNKDDSNTPNSSDQRQQEVPNSKPKGESIKEDWYGQHQKQPDDDEGDLRNKVPVGRGHGLPGSKWNEDYNKHDYQDYFNYYDRNPVRGYPNRYPYNYRNMYGQGDYQDYQDYSRQGNNQERGKGGPGGRGRGNNHNWLPVKSRYGAEDNGEDHRADEDDDDDASQNEMAIPKDKIQGDAHDQGHPNSADVPHSRRLRPGLWKIWRYMYGSSAPDYTTEYPHDTDNSNNRVEGAETADKNDADEMDSGIEDEHQDITNRLPMEIPSTGNTLVSNPGSIDTTSKPLQTHKPNVIPDPGSPPDQSNNFQNMDDNKLTRTTSASEQHKVRAAGKQTVTATAVLPLTIGLFLTMFLLLMMSCRLRYMNRRLRYGRLKTNNVHDADYLINGMYL